MIVLHHLQQLCGRRTALRGQRRQAKVDAGLLVWQWKANKLLVSKKITLLAYMQRHEHVAVVFQQPPPVHSEQVCPAGQAALQHKHCPAVRLLLPVTSRYRDV